MGWLVSSKLTRPVEPSGINRLRRELSVSVRQVCVWTAVLLLTGCSSGRLRVVAPEAATPRSPITVGDVAKLREVVDADPKLAEYRTSVVRGLMQSKTLGSLGDRIYQSMVARTSAILDQYLEVEETARETANLFPSVGAVTIFNGDGKTEVVGSCVLISPTLVLTAQHVVDKLQGLQARVFFGNAIYDLRPNWSAPLSAEPVPIPDRPAGADIAVLRLVEPVGEWLAVPTTVARPRNPVLQGEMLLFVGFGKENLARINKQTGPELFDLGGAGIRRRAETSVALGGAGAVQPLGAAAGVLYNPVLQFVVGSLTGCEGNALPGQSGGGVFRIRSNGRHELVGLIQGGTEFGLVGCKGTLCVRLDPVFGVPDLRHHLLVDPL